ncbi:MAG: GNAT family N-acetyltransferase [Alteraurantiacibacter sp.]
MAEPPFLTERLALRPFRDGDLPLWLEHFNTHAVRQYLGGVHSEEQARASFARMAASWDADGFGFLAIEQCSDGMLVGTCGIGRVLDEPAPEPLASGRQLGWQLRPEAWGLGYATEAARALMAYGFTALALETVWAQTSERNRGSWAVMQRLGMTRRAELDYSDPAYPPEDNPAMVWSIDRKDWHDK